MLIIINTREIAEEMNKAGIKSKDIKNENYERYSEALIDALTEIYDLEGKITEEFKKREFL